jgi:prophage antirepressor-like protein
MSKFQKWVLRKIFADILKQGSQHQHNAATVYMLLREAWFNEFYEDNQATGDAALREAFNATQADV